MILECLCCFSKTACRFLRPHPTPPPFLSPLQHPAHHCVVSSIACASLSLPPSLSPSPSFLFHLCWPSPPPQLGRGTGVPQITLRLCVGLQAGCLAEPAEPLCDTCLLDSVVPPGWAPTPPRLPVLYFSTLLWLLLFWHVFSFLFFCFMLLNA